MNVVGIQRLLLIVILVAVNAALAAGVYVYFMPQGEKMERESRALRAQVGTMQADTDMMRTQFDEIKDIQDRYNKLRAAGFFSTQSRAWIKRGMDDLQKKSHILKVDYKIDAAQVTESEDLKKAGFVMLDSVITVDLEAVDDADIYNFIFWVENAFPGHVSVKSLKIDRAMDINEASLRRIGNGSPLVLVTAKVVFSWKTLAPKDETAAAAEGSV
ncbi:MAG: hypothetical protein H6868_05975 [Rhodospirillales bacterium]|nr:hypothetical protein [Rhodospirillales bacterium]